jgi:cell wall-associated NlpC family hydrolase
MGATALIVSVGSLTTIGVDPASARAAAVVSTPVSQAAGALLAVEAQLQVTPVPLAAATPGAVLASSATTDPTGVTSPYQQIVAQFADRRAELARLVAAEAGVSAIDLDAVWAKTDDRRMVAVYSALSQVGTLYKRRGVSPGGFDCSGFTSWAWAQAGVEIPRSSSGQIRSLESRGATQLQPGDLVWRPGHIMMYLGIGDAVVHSPQSGRRVSVAKWGKVKRFGSPLANA